MAKRGRNPGRGQVTKAAPQVTAVTPVYTRPNTLGSTQTPALIEAGMARAGMNNSANMGPGRPLNPSQGYSGTPRASDYPVGVNISTQGRAAWGRPSFDTLKNVIDAYDVARFCFVPGTLVVTQRGAVPIEDVLVGDLTITHEGRWRRVTEVIENAPGRPVFSVDAAGLDTMHATGNHPVLAATYKQGPTHKREFLGAEWLQVDELVARGKGTPKAGARFDGLTLPVLTFSEDRVLDLAATLGDHYTVDAGTLVPAGNRRNSTPVPATVPFDAALGRILGWYLAEGSTSGGRNVFFSLAETERNYADQIAADLAAVFGLRASVELTPEGTGAGLTVRVSSTPLAKLLSSGTARNKTVPTWAWDGSREFFAAVLDAWATGDGCTDQRTPQQSVRTRVYTSSKSLAWQMRMVAIGLGLEASVVTTNRGPNCKTPIIRGKVINTHPTAYRVEWRDKPVRWGVQSFEADGRLLATAVRSVEPYAYDGPVYNLEVEDDHSFLTTAGMVHNCITHKISELRSMELMFLTADGVKGDLDDALDAARTALAFPDRELPFDSWLSKWMESCLRYDAGTLYRRRDKAGQVIGLEVIDGSSIAPYINEHGRRPRPPEPAYYQTVHGQVWEWFTSDDIIYTPFNPQPDSPYGLAPIESILLTANTDLRFQYWFLQSFTEGSLPSAFGEVPADLTSPAQVQEFQDFWDATMEGDQAQKHKIKWVPAGTKFTPVREQTFSSDFSEYLMARTCAAFGVVPQDLGMVKDVNRANGETQTDIQFRVNTLPWVRFVEGILTRYLQRDLGLPVRVALDTGRDKADRLAEAEAMKFYVDMGALSPDEVRSEVHGLPIDNQRPTPRFYASRLGPIPLLSIEGIAGLTDPETYGPADGQKVLDQPFVPANSVLPMAGTTDAKQSLAAVDAAQVAGRAALVPADAAATAAAQDGVQVAKEVTAGVTSATGITGSPLSGELVILPQDDEDEDDDEVGLTAADLARELAAFGRFTKARAKAGKWRDFTFAAVDAVEAQRLNEHGRTQILAKAGDPWAGHPARRVEAGLVPHHQDAITAALGRAVSKDDVRSAVAAYLAANRA